MKTQGKLKSEMKNNKSLHQFLKFGMVGIAALVIDVGTFNLLLFVFNTSPFVAKSVSVTLAVIFSFLGNKIWSFKLAEINPEIAALTPPLSDIVEEREVLKSSQQFSLFVVVNVIALLFPLTALYVSRNILGYTSVLSDNISANAIGLIVGVVFRFYAYKFWVFATRSKKITQLEGA